MKNHGSGKTNGNYWYDDVYIWTDSVIGSGDALLGRIQHSVPLEPGDSYSASRTLPIPAGRWATST